MKYLFIGYSFNQKGVIISRMEQLIDSVEEANKLHDTFKDHFSNYEVIDNTTGKVVKTNFIKREKYVG